MAHRIVLLNEVNLDGDICQLSLMDGSEWIVSPGDLPTIATWIPTAEIRVADTNDGSIFSCKLTNLSNDVAIYARKVN